MAFRFYQGTPPVQRVAWKCPSCGGANTGPLEEGCVVCAVGKDAQPVAIAQVGELEPFAQWIAARYPQRSSFDREAMRIAWEAGAVWATRQPVPSVPSNIPPPIGPKPAGGWQMWIHPAEEAGTSWSQEPVDARTQQTITAALAFYRDNQLAYGAVPGQLSAAECTELIAKLQPVEEEVSQ